MTAAQIPPQYDPVNVQAADHTVHVHHPKGFRSTQKPVPVPPVAVGDLVEVFHECPARDCYVVPRECTHVAAQQWCPEPPAHKRSLRVVTVEPLAAGGCCVEVTRCTGVPLHVELDPDGLPVST